jgi:uncharacterized protein
MNAGGLRDTLSISGGGIRGIIPCCMLIALEQQTGKLVRDCFSYVAGTSTGADLCALIQAGVPMTTALTFYTGEDAKSVFSPHDPVLAWAKRVIDGYIYDPHKLAASLKTALGPDAGWTINDCPTGVLIIACDASGHPWFFCKDNRKNKSTTGACSLVDAVVASSAAPTYFNFWPVVVGTETLQMADGGAAGFANPVYRMAIEMFEYDTFDPSATQIISLGTGYYKPPAAMPAPKGLIATIGFATTTLVDSSEDLADQDTRRVYPACGFQKFNPPLPSSIDEADLSSVPVLLEIGQAGAAQVDWPALLG